jgi:hypothetical protein
MTHTYGSGSAMDGEASDRTLVKRLLAGDEEAFEEF